jgi:hypothetical protein
MLQVTRPAGAGDALHDVVRAEGGQGPPTPEHYVNALRLIRAQATPADRTPPSSTHLMTHITTARLALKALCVTEFRYSVRSPSLFH